MAKQLNVNLNIKANASQAQQTIQNLQTKLTEISNTKITVDGGSIDTAAQSAKLLNEHLTKATNVTTGKIDFSALSNSLKAANTDLVTLSNNLLAAGPKGQQAFSQIANAIAQAELSTRKTNKALQNFGVTLMNTIKWQAASSMIHGVMGAFNSAVSHIEKLDKSLNSIQIVSGKTSAEMASFAKAAQSAAKALSSTTTEYADAALIYFQQGLGEKAIAERTEATLKMAKVTGDAVSVVSDQLTAIWNNFDDGSKSLEHYVDVITALGAATASSTDEIADGLQKFAAIAETVGLSSEYAATALATVTSETRQSADIVGTAFKTLFARIQGLNLGETLDDGTTLNKYSEALAKVGIDIKLSNGELKDMNDILDEMGDKWKRLNEDQQIALAQTVGGVRQYNQLIALMDNWDTFKINLDIAENSKGELDKQFEIYQSSIEASAAELKNATQTLYENILNPEMITSFNEALSDTIGLINTIVENAGGIGKLFEFGGLLLLQMVLPKLQGFLMNAATHMKDFIGYTKAAKMYEVDVMAKTSHAIAGTSQRTNTRLSSVYEEGSGKANRFERREDRRMNSYDKWNTKANAAQETLGQGPQKGLRHRINVVRASVADAKAQAYSDSAATFMPATQGIAGVDMDASAMTMRNQMIQEEAGYTATILDTKKQILALEDGLTDKQREGYKAYSDQVAKEQEALRLAREKQAVTKDAAEQSSRSGTMKVGSSKVGRDAKAAMKQGEIDQLEEERKKKISSLTGDKESISRQTSEIDKEYNKKKEEVQNRYISNKQVDLKGDETKSMVEGFKDSDMSDTGQAITQSMTENLTQSADGSGPAASVENLEKLGQLQAQYNADAAKASGIYTELSGNIGEAGKRTEQQQKALKKTGDTMKSLGKDAKSGLVDSLKESAKQMEKTGDSAEELKKVIKSLEDGSDIDLGELNPKEIDAVKKSVGDLDEGLTEAGTSARELVDAMAEDMASATDQDAKIFTGIAEDAQTAKASALDADGAAKQLQNTLNTQLPVIPDPFGTVIQGATQAMEAFTSFTMGTQMLSTGITTAFDENASAVERLMGVMMILQGVMSTVTAIQTAANAVDTFAVAIKAAKTAASAKESAAESKGIIATVANTIATAANAVAKLFAAEASKGLAGVIAGVLGAALIAGTIAIVANTVATQQDTEAKQEEAAAAEESAAGHRENAEALREETKELNKNADSYRKLYRIYQESGEVKTDLKNATYELATSLGVENASLLVLQGQYEALNAEIEKNLKLKNEEAMKAAKEATDAAGFSFAIKAGAGEGYWADDGDNDGQYTTGLWADTANTSWINDFLNSDKGKKYAAAGIKFVDGKLMADYDIQDPSQLAEIWALIDEMLSSGSDFWQAAPDDFDITNSTLQASFRTMKEKMGDTYTQMIEAPQAELEQALITGITHTGLNNATDLDSFGKAYIDYIDYVKEQAGPFADSAKVIADAQNYLRNHSSYGELFQQYEAFTQLPDKVRKMAESEGWTKDKNTLSLLLTTYFPEDVTEEQIKTLLELGQRMLDNSELTAQIKFIPSLGDQLKDDMSKADWDNWFAEWEKQGLGDFESVVGVSKNEFMSMSAARAQELLDSVTPTNDIEVANHEIDLLKEQRNIIADAGYKQVDTNYLSNEGLGFAKAWLSNRKEDGTLDVEAMLEWMQSQGLQANNAQDVMNYAQKLFEQQPYQFGYEAKSIDEYFSREVNRDKADEEATNQNRVAYDGALQEWDTKIEAATQEAEFLEATAFKRKALSLGLEVAEVEDYAEALEDLPLVETREEAMQLSIENSRMNKSFEDLADGFDEWRTAIDAGKIGSQEYALSLKNLKRTFAEVLTIDASQMSDDFFTSKENLELMQKAIEGNIEAFEQLRILAAQDIIENAGVNRPLQTYFNGLINKLSGQEIEIGTSIDQNQFAKDLLVATQAAGVATSTIQSMFDALGWETTIRAGKIDLEASVYRGGASETLTIPEQEAKKSKKLDSIKKEDMIDRYKELNDSLETVTDAMSDAEKAADRLYGRSRLKQMEKVNDELLKEIDLQKRKRKEAEEYLKNVDKPAVEEAFKALSSEFGLGEEIQLQFNPDDSIKNIEAIMDMIIAAYKAKAEELKDSMNEADKALLENMKTTIEAFKKAISQYDDTRSIIREAENARQDAFNKWQDNNYEQLSYSLEIDLEINEAKLQDLEYRINRLGDTAAEMAEAISLIYSSTGGSQYDFYDEAIKRYASQRDTLDTAYRSGRISQADYIEGLREVSDGIYENLEALADLDKMMMEYYGNTLAAANEELDKFIERMSHSAGILEHYSSIMDLLGKSSDYKTMGVILEGQADVAENQAKSSKAIMEMMQGEAEDRYRAYQDALTSGDKAAAELYWKQYEEALAAAQEAEDEYLSNAEQWAESLKAILENKLADLGKTLEEALTGGTSFEQLTTQMERAASLQEEYLTSTNQIYETTKMMRAAQQEIDKTTNTVAKNKIANFIAETKQLQNQSKLSQYELDVQQAKYDLLLAEIALQEAQNAKSTVRLQRDAEGNFGYVYTADSSAIADATQKYEDAQNALYNIGLEGANDYGQKYQQTMNEMYDSLTELQNQYLSGAFESESAYNLAVEEAKRYYYAKLEQYSSLYATATMTDSRVVAEAWFNDFSEMMTTSETWKLAVEEHVANVSSAFGEWQSQVEAIASDAGIGGDLESLKSKVNGIVLETSSLTTELTKQGGTIDSLQDSLDTVKQSTDAYAELREQLQIVAERYRQVAKAASEAAAAEALIDRSNEQIKDFGEQADECIRKIESTYAEMEEKLKEVKEKYLKGEIDEKQYNEQVEAIKNQYYEELKKLSQEYREILAKDNDLVAEDWFLTLEEMLKDKETFNQSVQEYLKEVEEYFKNMGQTTQDVAVETGGILKTFTADVGGVKEAIDLLNKSIVDPGGLADAFKEQDGAIENSCGLYGDLDTKLRTVIQTYEALAAAARDAAHAQSSVSGGGGGGSSYSGIDMHIPRSEFSYAHFDTGGYTGQWGSYGKLAMLHEKELVLNKGDTENFLASMGILNNILQTIDLQSANAQIGGILTTPNFHGGGNDMLEQNVHIEASFPNVQNSNDIEEAFNNLINRASQYANRK